MVKRGGTKRKADMRKITDKSSKAETFSKRRDGLFSKAAQLCVLGDAQIAILATPSSSNSNVSFFSFGPYSVDSVVSAYHNGKKAALSTTHAGENFQEWRDMDFEQLLSGFDFNKKTLEEEDDDY